MLKRKKQIIAKVMATTMLASTLASAFTIDVSAAESRAMTQAKISGDDRYKTAVAISTNYSSTSTHAVIVNGQKGIVDALTATPYASLKKAPILMTQSTSLNADTKAELSRRKIKTVDIVGGVNSVSNSVKAEIEAMGITVNRIAGDSKYETALEVAKKIDAISDISKIAVANGEVLADAVSVAAPAAQNKMPIILAHPTKGLDAETKAYINGEGVSTSYVIGGTSSVSTTTQNSLPGTKKRLEGTDRQATNASVIQEFYTSSSYDNLYVTKSGQVNKADEIADALAVGVLAAANQDPVVLVGKNLGTTQKTLLESKELSKITEVGNGIPTAAIDGIKNTQSTSKTVTTVADFKTALTNAKDGQTINFSPTSTISEALTISTTKNVTINLNGTHSGAITVNMASGTLNINGNVSNKVSVDAVKTITVSSGKTVKELVLNSGAKSSTLTNKGTITTATVSATAVTVTNSGTITTLNPNGDTTINNTGTIGNMDASNVVASITSPNAKQVIIRFNKVIERNSVINDNGTITNTDDDKLLSSTVTFIHTNGADSSNQIIAANCHADLDKNGKILTITAEDTKFFKGNYTVEVDNLVSLGIEQEKYVGTLNVSDKTLPIVSDVKYDSSSDKFKVTLSEPIQTTDRSNTIVTVNANIPTGTLTWNSIGNSFEFVRPNGVEFGKDTSIFIDGIKDAAGNKINPTTKTVKVTNSDLDIISAKQISNNEIEFKFNKIIALEDRSKINKNNIILEKQSPTTNPVTISTVSTSDGQTYKVVFETITYPSANKRTFDIKIAADLVKDVTGIPNKVIKESITLNKDITTPQITSVKAKSNNTGLEVVLSESVTLTDASKIKLFKGEGVSIASTATLKDAVNSKSNTILVTASAGVLSDGTYHVKFEQGAVTDINANENKLMSTNKVTIKNIDNTEYKIEEIENAKEADEAVIPNKFIVRYTGDLDTEKISYKNFKLVNNKEIHETSVIDVDNVGTSSDGKIVKTITITLPATDSIDLSGSANLVVSGLTLKSGKVLATESGVVTVRNNTAPTLKSAEVRVKTAHQLVLTFDKNIELVEDTFTNEFAKENLEEILKVIKITTGTNNTVYTGSEVVSKEDMAKIEVINGKQLVVSIKATDTTSKWTTEVEKLNNNVKVSIIKDQNLLTDIDIIGGVKLNAREVKNISVSRNQNL